MKAKEYRENIVYAQNNKDNYICVNNKKKCQYFIWGLQTRIGGP